jgi:alkanesulfonate monooxygenase SsuD/methylene tetrahydromethanopterin reductase-like flavin-dependent oxidoreductase (luciferase family)
MSRNGDPWTPPRSGLLRQHVRALHRSPTLNPRSNGRAITRMSSSKIFQKWGQRARTKCREPPRGSLLVSTGARMNKPAHCITAPMPIAFGVTDHLEGELDEPSQQVFDRIVRQTRLADELGFDYAWFAEHHAHLHQGHCPAPLLCALHLAEQTRRIRLGTAIICLNLHHPLSVAEQTATADLLTRGRMAIGFGSGSTPEEFALFGLPVTEEADRHARFQQALRLIQAAWRERVSDEVGRPFNIPPHAPLPMASADLTQRSWLAVNSIGAARIAGGLGFNMLFSHLRTPAEYRAYSAAYAQSGGKGAIAANRPVYVGRDDASAFEEIEPALRILWRRFRKEGKVAAETSEPPDPRELCGHPINFIIGGPQSVAAQLADLHGQAHYDVANLEVRWAGSSEGSIEASLRLLANEVRPRLHRMVAGQG